MSQLQALQWAVVEERTQADTYWTLETCSFGLASVLESGCIAQNFQVPSSGDVRAMRRVRAAYICLSRLQVCLGLSWNLSCVLGICEHS